MQWSWNIKEYFLENPTQVYQFIKRKCLGKIEIAKLFFIKCHEKVIDIVQNTISSTNDFSSNGQLQCRTEHFKNSENFVESFHLGVKSYHLLHHFTILSICRQVTRSALPAPN